MYRAVAVLILCGLSAFSGAAGAEPTRTSDILERMNDANRWRDHVMVVAHRGGGLAGARKLYPENSRAAVENAIRLGAEMIEIDVQKTSDGVYVALHDTWLDRTTTCKGPLVERTAEDLKECRLVVEGTGQATAETIPTLRDMLALTHGRILFNIDNKLDPAELSGMVAEARAFGMERELIIKQNLFNTAKVRDARKLVADLGQGVGFMPIIADDAVRDIAFLELAASAVGARAVELINWRNGAKTMTEDGGPLFSTRARAVAARGNWHLWINTYGIVNKESGYLSGGRGDELAVSANMPDEVYGFWVDRGVTIIQTDEPAAAIRWLETNGYRIPYASDTVSEAHNLGQ